MTEKWDKVYSEIFGGQWAADEGLVRFTARFLKRRVGIEVYEEKRKVKRILDAGCGNGRHIIFFAEQGFDIFGVDISPKAIEISSAWTKKRNLKADLEVADVKKLPFSDNSFDVVISFGVLDHIPFAEAKEAFAEMTRVCAKGGYLYLSLRSTEDSDCGRGTKVANNTYLLVEGYEKGIIQHFFDQKDIEELIKGFRVFDVELHEQRFPKLFTVDKSFIQSSRSIRKYLDLHDRLDFDLKYSRWHIAAERV